MNAPRFWTLVAASQLIEIARMVVNHDWWSLIVTVPTLAMAWRVLVRIYREEAGNPNQTPLPTDLN